MSAVVTFLIFAGIITVAWATVVTLAWALIHGAAITERDEASK